MSRAPLEESAKALTNTVRLPRTEVGTVAYQVVSCFSTSCNRRCAPGRLVVGDEYKSKKMMLVKPYAHN
jgi:hypothetical protein